MRKRQFLNWLGGQPVNANTAAMRVRAVARIEAAYGLDLDDAFERDGLAGLLDGFGYTTEDAAQNRPNPTRMNITRGDIRSQVAWYRTQLNSYRKFCEAAAATGSDVDGDIGGDLFEPEAPAEPDFTEETDAEALTFGLEADLEDALRAALDQLEEGLVLADGGRQRKVSSGFIDILGQGVDGARVVIELKAGRTRPDAVAQVLGYMADIAQEDQTDVRGYLIGADHHERVCAAARAVPNLALRRYSYRFSFEE